jgi:hypothetical protein
VRRALAFAVAALILLPAAASASVGQETTFQDDDHLVFGDADTQRRTLDTLKSLGADRIRASIFWHQVAPEPRSKQKPSFDASDPNAYPAPNWERYDRLVRFAAERGIAINLNVTGPAPNWATGNPGSRPDLEAWWRPSPAEFGAFMTALGRRYSGSFVPPPPTGQDPPPQPQPPPGGGDDDGIPGIDLPPPPFAATTTRQAPSGEPPLPRVDYWSLWNEPNQPGWLAPQWSHKNKRWNEAAPAIYRGLADAAWNALHATGHGVDTDTILVGELAPKGLKANRGPSRAIDALRFVRVLYCVGRRYRPLRRSAATRVGCPANPANFAEEHPVLFASTGFAHHPYELQLAPNKAPRHREWVTIANLPRLSTALSRVLAAHGRRRTGGMPLYLTEFGYQTTPPDPFGVSFRQQAAYLNQSEFIAYYTPQVRTLGQFLLRDDDGDPAKTFQSGLMTLQGKRKPSYNAFKLPIFLPVRRFETGDRVRVWGLVRPAPNGTPQEVTIEYRRARTKTWRALRTITSEAGRGYVDGRVSLPASGHVRLKWGSLRSRAVKVKRRRSR